MQNTDRAAFAEAMQTTLEIYGRDLSDNALEAWWRMLEPFSIDQVRRALQSHLTESPYPPKPADVIQRLLSQDGRPSADEAWHIALQAMDEDATVLLTDEIAQAKSVADPVYGAGDEVGARMAFRARYNSLLQDARSCSRPVRWWISAGHDPYERAEKVEQFLLEGRITEDQARRHLPSPQAETPALADALRGAVEKIGSDSGASQDTEREG